MRAHGHSGQRLLADPKHKRWHLHFTPPARAGRERVAYGLVGVEVHEDAVEVPCVAGALVLSNPVAVSIASSFIATATFWPVSRFMILMRGDGPDRRANGEAGRGDCYRGELPAALLLVPAFPGVHHRCLLQLRLNALERDRSQLGLA